jgi:hypothetical protein
MLRLLVPWEHSGEAEDLNVAARQNYKCQVLEIEEVQASIAVVDCNLSKITDEQANCE